MPPAALTLPRPPLLCPPPQHLRLTAAGTYVLNPGHPPCLLPDRPGSRETPPALPGQGSASPPIGHRAHALDQAVASQAARRWILASQNGSTHMVSHPLACTAPIPLTSATFFHHFFLLRYDVSLLVQIVSENCNLGLLCRRFNRPCGQRNLVGSCVSSSNKVKCLEY